MKKLLVTTVLAVLLSFAPAIRADEPDHDAIADNLVNQSAAVQPGEIVVINGGPTEVDLMGAIQVAVQKAGGQPVISLNIPTANKRGLMETPLEHLGQLPTANLLMTKMADVFINVGSVQDPDLFSDAPEERLAVARKAGVPLTRAISNARFRSATLGQTGGIPTRAYAESVGADYDEITEIFWSAVGVAPADLASRAASVSALLQDGATAKMTSEAGTDITFAIGAEPARINAGRTADVVASKGSASTWLPAGEVYACVQAGSANGTLVVPWTQFRGLAIENLRLTFENGRLTELSADTNQAVLQDFLDASTDQLRELSIVDLGINSESRAPAGSSYKSWEMGGMVTAAATTRRAL
jgi:aminopeptidase